MPPPTSEPLAEVGTGMAPLPSIIAGSASVAQGGPVPSTTSASTTLPSAGSAALPATGHDVGVPVVSGVGLALIGAALMRLRRRPSWD